MPDATTVLDALLAALAGAASAYNSADQVAPVVTLWPDGEELWAPLLPLVREAARERGLLLLTLGPYDPDNLTGPAIWLRCVIAGTLPPPASTHPPSSVLGPPSSVPIVYLPGVSRSDLRPVEAMKAELRPLIELQFRGVVWAQRNGKNEKDWTLLSFLKSPAAGLNLPLSNDAATREALRNVLLTLAEQTLESLRREPLTPARLNALVNPDEIRSLLRWMSDPKEKTFDKPDIWAAFCSTCKERYGFNPETDGRITAAGFLGERTDAWDTVWNRFVEAPTLYPGIPALLRQARPQSGEGIFFQASSWPQDNEAQETALRGEMLSLENAPPAEARKAIRRLDKIHGARREWVWAALGNAPLARALPALLDLADATESPLTGSTPGDLALGYTSAGWQADAALIQALSRVEGPGDELAVKAAAKALYLNWLRDGAEAFQAAVKSHPLPIPEMKADLAPGRCVLFADGLRYDVGRRLSDELRERGLQVNVEWKFSALPGVTATAKPAAAPLGAVIGPGSELAATALGDGAEMTADVLRRELEKAGYDVLLGGETGNPTGAAWTEAGSLDSCGHTEGWKLARRMDEVIRGIAARIEELIAAGWREVRMVTDHGWLLLPGGLPKVELPEHLTVIRKGRCARLKPSASFDGQTVPWTWDSNVRIAVAPGVGRYVAGKEYEHGGLSVQECVIPVLTVSRSLSGAPQPISITDVKWKGLRCHINVSGARPGLHADLRTKAADPASSLTSQKPLSEQGSVALVVADEDRVGEAAFAVILNDAGDPLAQQLTTVGGE